MDRGKEFINQKVLEWCNHRGIELHLTAPYSSSQNGIAKCMNRTLVELARAMIKGQDLPEFIWEYAISHAAYIRNRVWSNYLEIQETINHRFINYGIRIYCSFGEW